MHRSLFLAATSAMTIVSVLAATACTHPSQTRHGDNADRAAYLVVQNTLPEPFRMYVSDGSQRLPMGSINPLSTARLRIPPSVVFPAISLTFIAVPTSGNNPAISERLAVSPGEEIRIQLAR